MQTGIKDTVQEFYFEKLFSSYKGKHGPHVKQQALDAAVAHRHHKSSLAIAR